MNAPRSGTWVAPDAIRARFSAAMSEMYRAEVPQYGALLDLVAETNRRTLAADPKLADRYRRSGELTRLEGERHGAIRLGTAGELRMIGRAFAVMGMKAVGYYDLAAAGVPVHSTAFRPVTDAALAANPFRVFTSLLRLELIDDPALRAEAETILAARSIVTPDAIALIEQAEREGGLNAARAADFVAELIETFRWHSTSTVDAGTYAHLLDAHRLIADVVSFRGPHINHLTPRTLDIDAAQAGMAAMGMAAKASIEGPPRRRCPILLRQTSFKALDEAILFPAADGTAVRGYHTARFGEIEARGVALTRKGRALYDAALAGEGDFADLPDDWDGLRGQGLAYFRQTDSGFEPITYEDFLPVSAAGIFRSNLGEQEVRSGYGAQANKALFEAALGRSLIDEFDLYDAASASN